MPYLAQGNRSSAGSFEKLTEEVHNQCVDMVSFYNCLSGYFYCFSLNSSITEKCIHPFVKLPFSDNH